MLISRIRPKRSPESPLQIRLNLQPEGAAACRLYENVWRMRISQKRLWHRGMLEEAKRTGALRKRAASGTGRANLDID